MVDRHQPLDRIGDVGVERTQHRRHPVGVKVSIGLGTDGHRHHRHQRLGGEFVPLEQVVTQHAGADGHHDIVQGDAVGTAHDLGILDRE